MRVTQIFETCLYCEDLSAAERFYCEVLGLEVVSRFDGRGLALRCDRSVLLLFNPHRTQIKDREVPTHGAFGQGHVAFAATGDELSRWRRHLQSLGVAIEAEVEWPEGGRSLYFRDPAGNSVELAPATLWGLAAAPRP